MKAIAVILVAILNMLLTTFSTAQSTSNENVRATFSDSTRGFSFEHPKQWSVEDIKEMNGLLVTSPTLEANWQANLFFELRTDKENRKLDVMMDDLTTNLSKTKKNFKLVAKKTGTMPSKLQFGQIEYTHTQDDVALTELEVIIPLAKDKLLFVVASWVTSLDKKYRPVCNAIIESIKSK